jgi:GntR family frlABCD operon transcriptional regulator
MKLNGNLLNPLYTQMKRLILEDINNGKYKYGEQLPIEAELCKMYGVSIITTRRAMSDLVQEGVLYRQQGKGTFITGKKIKNELIALGGFSELSLDIGKPHRSRILRTNIIPANENQAENLQVSIGDPLLSLERVIYLEDDPLFIDTSLYSCKRFPAFETYINETNSTYLILKERYNTVPVSNDKTINVISAQKEAAELLKVDVGTTLFEMLKVVFDEQNTPVHTSVLLMPTNRVTLTISNRPK